jgi:hypothetical protein
MTNFMSEELTMWCRGSGRCGAGYVLRKVLCVAAGVAVLAGVLMLLWNWLVPTLFFSAGPVSYVQALGLLVLSRILFGRIHCGGFRGSMGHLPRAEGLSSQEREYVKEHVSRRWSKWCCSKKNEDDAAPRSE